MKRDDYFRWSGDDGSGDTIPAGFCAACAEKIRDGGMPGKTFQTAFGVSVVAVFCFENQVGAWTGVKDGEVVEPWEAIVPIEAEAWSKYVAGIQRGFDYAERLTGRTTNG